MSRECCTCQYCLPCYGIDRGEARHCVIVDNPNATIPLDCPVLRPNAEQIARRKYSSKNY